jgi:uncharacterized protein (TIGR02246 family)
MSNLAQSSPRPWRIVDAEEEKSKGESIMRKRNIVILALAASLTAIVIAPGFAADDAKTIAQRLDDSWVAAYNKNDAAAITGLYTADAALLPQGTAQPIFGASNIREYIDGMMKQKLNNLVLPVAEAKMLDPKTIYQVGTWTADAGDQHLMGTYMSVIVQDGANWKYVADTWNMMPPPAAAAANK